MEPGPKIVDDKTTEALTGGLSRRQRERMAADGKFPQSVRLTEGNGVRPGRIGWVESEVLAWNAARIAERDAKTKPTNGAHTGTIEPAKPKRSGARQSSTPTQPAASARGMTAAAPKHGRDVRSGDRAV
jgi:predicted DNA-binding transcriptional regulator AlpA